MSEKEMISLIIENKWDVCCVDFYRKWAVGNEVDLRVPEEERLFVIRDTLYNAIKAAKEHLADSGEFIDSDSVHVSIGEGTGITMTKEPSIQDYPMTFKKKWKT